MIYLHDKSTDGCVGQLIDVDNNFVAMFYSLNSLFPISNIDDMRMILISHKLVVEGT